MKKKVISLLLVVALLVSVLPFAMPAFADDNTIHNSIINTGSYRPTTSSDPSGDEPGATTLSKTATLVSGTANQWDIKVDVKGVNASDYKTTDVVLVIDASLSMFFSTDELICTDAHHTWRCCNKAHGRKGSKLHFGECDYSDCTEQHEHTVIDEDNYSYYRNNGQISSSSPDLCYKSRITVTKAAVKDFIDTVAQSEGKDKIRVSIVSFYGTAKTQIGLTNVNTTAGVKALKDAVDSITLGSATNIHAGLEYAKTVLQDSNAVNKTVVLLSDGEPNRWGTDGDGKSSQAASKAKETAAELKRTTGNNAIKAKIYTLGFDVSDTATQLLKDIASTSADYYAVNGANIGNIFGNIAGTVIYAAENATVIDPMGEMFTLVDIDNDSSLLDNIYVSVGNVEIKTIEGRQVLVWNMGRVVEGQEIYMTYRVKISDSALSEVYYDTNGKTTIYYDDLKGDKVQKDFDVPQVQIGKGNIRVIGYLVDGNGNFLAENGQIVTDITRAAKVYGPEDRAASITGHAATVSAPAVENYSVYTGNTAYPASKEVTLTAANASQTVEFLYCVAQGKIEIQYEYENLDGSFTAVGDNAEFFGGVNTSFDSSNIVLNKNKTLVPNSANYQDGVLATSVPASFTNGTQTVKVRYMLKTASVKVNYYKDSLSGTKLGEAALLTNVKVGTAIDQSAINLNAYLPANYNNGVIVSAVPAAVPAAGAEINVVYTVKQAGLTINFVFIGGSQSKEPVVINNLSVGSAVDVAAYENQYKNSFADYTLVNTDVSLDGTAGAYTLPEDGGSITLTFRYQEYEVKVQHVYPDKATVTTEPVKYFKGTVLKADENFDGQVVIDLENGKYTAAVSHTEDITLNGNVTIVVTYSVAEYTFKVNYVYPADSGFTKNPTLVTEDYGTVINTADYNGDTNNGMFVEESRTMTGSFALTSNSEMTITMGYADAPVKVSHVYPGDTGTENVSDVAAAKINDTFTPNEYTDALAAETYNGSYEVSKIEIRKTSEGLTGSDLGFDWETGYTVPQNGLTVYIYYTAVMVPVEIVHEYPADADYSYTDSGTEKQQNSTFFGNDVITLQTNNGQFKAVGYKIDLKDGQGDVALDPAETSITAKLPGIKITIIYAWEDTLVTIYHNYSDKAQVIDYDDTVNVNDIVDPYSYADTDPLYTIESIDPVSDTRVGVDGLVITINYVRTTAQVTVNHIGNVYDVDGEFIRTEELGTNQETELLGDTIDTADYIKDFSEQGFAYESISDEEIVVADGENIVNIYYSMTEEELPDESNPLDPGTTPSPSEQPSVTPSEEPSATQSEQPSVTPSQEPSPSDPDEEIPDESAPLGPPATGDVSSFTMAMLIVLMAGSAIILGVMFIKRRKENNA